MVEPNRLLVTGGGGQVGRAFARLAPQAVVLDRASLDVTDRGGVLECLQGYRPEVVVNAAVYSKVDDAEKDSAAAMAINADAVANLANACDRIGALLVQISTDYVFDGNKKEPYVEDDEPAPLSVYGRTKLAGEEEAKSVTHLIVRTSWVFGDGRNFVRTIRAAAAAKPSLDVVDDQWGRPTYAVDLARGLLDLIDRDARGIYHLSAGGEPTTWARLAETIVAFAGLQSTINRVPTREQIAARPTNSVLDCSKATALGVALREWMEAVAEYLAEEAKELL